MQTVLIFRNEILRTSETFIRAQASALRSYTAHYVGLERVREGLEMPVAPTVLNESDSSKSKLRKLLYQQFGFAPQFHHRLAKLNAKLIHAHFAPDGVSALPLAAHLGLPLIVTLHGYDITTRWSASANTVGDRIYRARRGQLARKTSLFICVSKFIRETAIRKGIPGERLKVHYIGVDRGYFTPGNDKREPALILFVGRLVEKKGCANLLRALARVLPECPDARAVIVGDGPERASLETHALNAGLPCTFVGSQPPNVIRDWLRIARVFCVPSLTAKNGDSEGLGMVFAEAQATGLPVVSFAHGGVPEVVKHGESGLLAPEGDDKKLADHLVCLIKCEDMWQSHSRNGITSIANDFDLTRQTQLLEKLYSNVLADDCHPAVEQDRKVYVA